MQAILRTFSGLTAKPFHVVKSLMNLMAYRVILHGMWWLYHFAFNLQNVEFTWESDEVRAEELRDKARIYVCWHARCLGAVPLLSACKELHAVSMPHRGWGYEGFFQRNLRKAFFSNMNRKGFRFIELERGENRAVTVRRIAACVQRGKSVLMTADSPKGGAFVAQLGAVLAGSLSGVELVPFAFSSSRKIRINPFWDNFMVPVPLGTYHIRLGKPIRLEQDLNDEECESFRSDLANALNRVTYDADIMSGIRPEYRLRLPEGLPGNGQRPLTERSE